MWRLAALAVMVVGTLTSPHAQAETLEWIEQLGTSDYDGSEGVSADGLGSVYISGSTEGSLEGPNAGGWDAFLSKYDASGTLQWTRQFGTSKSDGATGGVSADGLGSIYISGRTKNQTGYFSRKRWRFG